MKKIITAAYFFLALIIVRSQNFTDSNLPIVMVQTGGQNLDSAFTDKIVWMGIIDNGFGNRNYITDSCNNYNGKIAINLRGSSKLFYPKKSWKFSLVDNQLQDINQSILGMPPENDWILEGIYLDKSLVRNSLTYQLHREMGRYSPRYVYVELIIDGEYRGIYGLTEKIKRDSYRVNISKLLPNEITGDDLTGGYIFALDHYWMPTDTGWFSHYFSNISNDSANYYLYIYPKPGNMPVVQKNYIMNFMHSFEQTMASNQFNDPDSGYYRFVESGSLVDFFLLNELSRNTDGYRLSSYFFKDKDSKGGKLNCGPMWDYDLAWDNCQFSGGHNPYGWQYNLYFLVNYIPFWWQKIISDPTFQYELRCRYQQLRQNILNENKLFSYIDSIANYLNESQIRNFTKWPILGQVIYPAPQPAPSDYTGEISVVKNWIQQRLYWLDNNIPGQCSLQLSGGDLETGTIKVSPNPFTDELSVLIRNTNYTRTCDWKLKSINGLELSNWRTTIQKNSTTEYKIPTHELSSGIYILESQTDIGKSTFILVKQN